MSDLWNALGTYQSAALVTAVALSRHLPPNPTEQVIRDSVSPAVCQVARFDLREGREATPLRYFGASLAVKIPDGESAALTVTGYALLVGDNFVAACNLTEPLALVPPMRWGVIPVELVVTPADAGGA